MLRKSLLLCAIVSICSLLSFGQEGEAPKGEIFGGYQFFHMNTGISEVGSFNLNGWNAAVSGYFTRNLGVTADFSGSYGSPFTVDTKFYTFMFGPSVRFPNSSRVTPFAHGLFGGGRISGEALGVSLADTNFTWAAGGGADVIVSRHLNVRLAQADFLQTRVASATQNHFRYSAGIVLKF